MGTFFIIASLVLLAVILLQIGKITEIAGKLRGEEDMQMRSNAFHARLGVVFMVGFLIFVIVSFMYYKNSMLGYGPHTAASEHGVWIDNLFNVTMIITGIVFFITHVLLFWFAYKYRERTGHKATFYPHNNMLEMIWMGIPAVVMTFLVIGGLSVWNRTMGDIPEDMVVGKDYIEVEATGLQWQWILRHPGDDGVLGERYYKNITGLNPLGQKWEDERNLDDIHPSELVLPVGTPVRVRIIARDVLHNFYLPHFRVKMDAVPGLPTYFVFTPTTTTEEYRQRLRDYPEWQAPSADDETKQRWETFNYELACAELCGRGHFSMKRIVRVVEPEEYVEWLASQKSYYSTTIQGTQEDTAKGVLSEAEETPEKDVEIKDKELSESI